MCSFYSCRLNSITYRIRLCFQIRKLVKNLDKIYLVFTSVVFGGFASAHRERALMHTGAAVHCSDVVRRDIDRDIYKFRELQFLKTQDGSDFVGHGVIIHAGSLYRPNGVFYPHGLPGGIPLV